MFLQSQNEDYEFVLQTINNPEHYKVLIKKYQERLLYYIRRLILVNKEDAEDVLQEVFIKAYQNLNGYNPKYKFSSWIYRIAHNEAISFTRGKHFKIDSASTIDDKFIDTLISESNIENEISQECTTMQVRQVLSRLEDKYREVLVLKFIEEMNYEEISDILHVSIGTVGSLISRAKDKFKKLIINK